MKQMIPYNLQFFAEGEAETTETTVEPTEVETKTEAKEPEEKKDEVDVQKLLNEVASLRRKADKAASEASEFKKKYKQTLSEKEQYDMEAAEAKAKHDEEFEALKAKVAISELKDKFVTLGYSVEQATTAARAEYEGDVDTLLKIQTQFTNDTIEAAKQKILSEMPQPNIGVGNTGGKQYTKEEFEKMSMIDRTKLKHENEAEYYRLLNL